MDEKKKIVIFLDELVFSWHLDLIKVLSKKYQPVLVCIQKSDLSLKNKFRIKNSFQIFKSVVLGSRLTKQHKIVKVNFDFFIEVSSRNNRVNIPIEKLYSICERPHFCFRLSSGIFEGEILTWSELGVLSLHHGDNRFNRGGPAGFYESVNDNQLLGITCQILSNSLDGGQVVGRWNFLKSNSFQINREIIYEHTSYCIENLINNPILIEPPFIYTSDIFKEPSLTKITQYYLKRFISKISYLRFNKPTWGIYLNIKKDKFSLRNYKRITPFDKHLRADPFILEYKQDIISIVYEKQSEGFFGEIWLMFYDLSSRKVTEDKLLIKENYHLSYPFVFKYKNIKYILPEQSQKNSFDYFYYDIFGQCIDKITLPYKRLSDITLFEKDGYFYAFATQKASILSDVILRLFICKSDKLDVFEEHINSPIRVGSNGGRMAGQIFCFNNELYRPAQNGTCGYGTGISFFKILICTPEIYSESLSYTSNDALHLRRKLHTFNEFEDMSIIDGIEY